MTVPFPRATPREAPSDPYQIGAEVTRETTHAGELIAAIVPGGSRMVPLRLILSCEHGGADIPARYQSLFQGREAQKALRTHRGSDLGALAVARELERAFRSVLAAPLHSITLSRLLIDTNRSETHPRLFSEWSSAATSEEKQALLRTYRAHRAAIVRSIDGALAARARVVHVAVHSFTPVLGFDARTADVGLLYDPARAWEKALCRRWQALLGDELRVRRNYPYRGTADGLTTALRRRYPASRYAGIELELGQALIGRAGPERKRVTELVESTLRALL